MLTAKLVLRHTRRSRSLIRTIFVIAAIVVLCGQMVLSFCRLTRRLIGGL